MTSREIGSATLTAAASQLLAGAASFDAIEPLQGGRRRLHKATDRKGGVECLRLSSIRARADIGSLNKAA